MIASSRAKHHPRLLLVRSRRTARTLRRLLLIGSVMVGLILAFTPWQQNSAASGRVIAYAALERQQPVDAPTEGRVLRWYVEEGQQVEAGDLLVELADNDATILDRLREEKAAAQSRVDAARARIVAVESRIDALKISRENAVEGAHARHRMARDRVLVAEQALTAAQAAYKAAELNQTRVQLLFDEGIQSKRALELADLEAVRTKTDVERASATLMAARTEEGALLADVRRVGSDGNASVSDANATKASALAEVASAAAEIARMEVRLARQTAQEVRAPRAGAVFRILAKQGGQYVKSGDALAILVPDTADRAVELWVDGNDINLVHPGRKVRLQFEGWPAVQFSGWPSAAVGTYGGRVAIVDSLDDGKGAFRIVVVPDGEQPWPEWHMLRQGTRAYGVVLMERVSLGYELWRTLNGFPPEWRKPAVDTNDAGKEKS